MNAIAKARHMTAKKGMTYVEKKDRLEHPP